MDFQSANATIIKSIKQRDLLNTWLRLYARDRQTPRISEYEPARLDDERPDLVYYSVDTSALPPRVIIESEGTRMSRAYGHTGKGQSLEHYVGASLAGFVMPVYHHCIARQLPVYTISHLDDVSGRDVAYERLLLPFAEAGAITGMIASLKTISEDGSFEISNLLRKGDVRLVPKLRAVIDRDLFHRKPGGAVAEDLIEIE